MMFVNKPHKILLLIFISQCFDVVVATIGYCTYHLQSCDACYDASNNIICDCWCEPGCVAGGCPPVGFTQTDHCYCSSALRSNEKCWSGTCKPTNNPTRSPTYSPTQSPSLLAYSEDKELFVAILNHPYTGNYTYAREYCQTHANYTDIAHIYSPYENHVARQLCSRQHTNCAIGYVKNNATNEWQWDNNYISNPNKWLPEQNPLLNIDLSTTTDNCMAVGREGWVTIDCNENKPFLCETRDHTFHFKNSSSNDFYIIQDTIDHSLNFSAARSVCRDIYDTDLAVIYDSEENIQLGESDGLKSSHNYWIGYQRDESLYWNWVYTSLSWNNPDNFINNPWENGGMYIICDSFGVLNISYAQNGADYINSKYKYGHFNTP
eukprot:553756_1